MVLPGVVVRTTNRPHPRYRFLTETARMRLAVHRTQQRGRFASHFLERGEVTRSPSSIRICVDPLHWRRGSGSWSVLHASSRTVGGLWDAVGRIIDTYTPAESTNYFAA